MSAQEHYREAERLLEHALTCMEGVAPEDCDTYAEYLELLNMARQDAQMDIAAAQVHATLATIPDPIEIKFAVAKHPAESMPAPRGYQCAAGCRHSINVHREHGCDVMDCECPAPFGRIVQSDVPDDASGITDVTS